MADKIIYAIGNILMALEAAAVIFLAKEWIKAKKGDGEDG